MATSQNGWLVLESGTSSLLTPIPRIIGRVRAGDVAYVFTRLLDFIDAEIEDVDAGRNDWGYAYRPVRGQTKGYSNHASGTAIDVNATQHPRGVAGTWTREQVARIDAFLAGELLGALRWGEHYARGGAVVDGMHFEINVPPLKLVDIVETITTVIQPFRATQQAPIQEDDDVATHYLFENGDTQYWLNPRDWTIRPVEARPGDGTNPGAQHRAEIATIVRAVGDQLMNWRQRPGAASISDVLAAVENFNYAGPAGADPRKG